MRVTASGRSDLRDIYLKDLLALLAASSFLAAPQTFTDAAPPDRFTKNAVITLELKDQAGIDAECQWRYGTPPAGMQTNGCAFDATVVAPNPCEFARSERYARLLCHELGHVNGWSSGHEL